MERTNGLGLLFSHVELELRGPEKHPLRAGQVDNDDQPPTSAGRNAEVGFNGVKRRNGAHVSTMDPDARLYRKGSGQEAKLCFFGHA